MQYNEEFISAFGKAIQESFDTQYYVNERKVNIIHNVYSEIKTIVSGEDIHVTETLFKPFPSEGSVSVAGKNIVFTDPETLVRLVKQADILDIWTKLDGTVVLDLCFSGLIK